MFIKHLALRNFRSFSFDIEFNPNGCVLIGPNGCGKTTVLDVLAATTGVDNALELVDDCSLGSLELVAVHDGKEHVLKLDGGFNPDSIAQFKYDLPCRSSYLLRHDLYEDDYVGERRNHAMNLSEMRRWMDHASIPIDRDLRVDRESGRVNLMIGDSGAKFQYTMIGMRLAPPHVPMLVENPERSLHHNARHHIQDFYKQAADHQLICTTHCPTVLSSFDDFSFRRTGFKRYIDLGTCRVK